MDPQPTVIPTTFVASELANVVTVLITSSLQPSSKPTYHRAWKLFELFHHSVFQSARFNVPVCPGTLALFIAYLFNQNCAPLTVNTYVSALGYSHRLYGVPDPTKIFYIIQMTGCLASHNPAHSSHTYWCHWGIFTNL
jgi:fatty-acid desaturase